MKTKGMHGERIMSRLEVEEGINLIPIVKGWVKYSPPGTEMASESKRVEKGEHINCHMIRMSAIEQTMGALKRLSVLSPFSTGL